MVRRLGPRRDAGAGLAQYAGLVVLAALILGALVALGVPNKLQSGIGTQICEIFQGSDCAKPQSNDHPGTQTAPGGDDPGGQQPGGQDPGGENPNGDEPSLGDLQKKADDAEKAANDADGKYGNIKQQIIDLLKDFIGITDIEECISKGSISSCLWAAFDIGSWIFAAAKIGKFAKAVKDAIKLWKEYNKGRKIIDRAKDAAKRAKDLLKKKRVACGLPANSFVAGTAVRLPDGRSRPIEDIRVGDRVLAVDPATGRTRPEPVRALIRRHAAETLVRLRLATDPYGLNSGVVTATDAHPFWSATEHRWIDAARLRVGDRLGDGTGGSLRVLERRDYRQTRTVYNLTVADLHTYTVSAAGARVLVHNAEEGCPRYSGDLEKVAKADPDADKLAERLGGESRVKFKNDPDGREFDAVSDEYVAQAKPKDFVINKKARDQAKATFEAAKQTGKKVYYHFDGPPDPGVTRKLQEYAERYGVEVVIDTKPF